MNQKVSGGKIMKEFVALTAKAYAYLMDNDGEEKNASFCLKIIKIACLMARPY